jgi:hypothetical protein
LCVNNKSNEIILNKYIEVHNKFSNEDVILDNNRVMFPERMQIDGTGWIKNSNMAYFASYDMADVFIVIDIDKKIVSQPNFTAGRGYEKVEIARAKGESIYFYIFDNELNYYCRENDDIRGTYSLAGDVPVNTI